MYIYSGTCPLPCRSVGNLLYPPHGLEYEDRKQILKNQVIRTDCARDGDPDWEENFYILRKTPCVAVLSENYFMDNKSDLEYLQNQTGKQAIIDTHAKACSPIQ